MNQETPRSLPFRLDAMVLVCKACGKRSSGPRHTKPKQLAQAFKQDGKAHRQKVRVLLTSCMGLCPKKAAAVAVLGADGSPHQFAIENEEQVPAALQASRPAVTSAAPATPATPATPDKVD